MNLQVIASPDGAILWVSGPLPGAACDLAAARIWGIVRELAAAGLVVLADKGYHGAGGHLRTPYKGKSKPESQKAPTVPTPSCAARRARRRPAQNLAHPANSAAARGRPGTWPKPATSCKPARTKDGARSVSRLAG